MGGRIKAKRAVVDLVSTTPVSFVSDPAPHVGLIRVYRRDIDHEKAMHDGLIFDTLEEKAGIK